MAGIVYYANYLKYIERARSDQIRELGVDQRAIKDDLGVVLAVRKLEADYVSAARLDDLLEVETTVLSVTGARMTYQQDIRKKDGGMVFSARVMVICMTVAGRPVRFPAEIRRKYAALLAH